MSVYGAADIKYFMKEADFTQLVIDPYNEKQLQAASYDFRISNKFAVFNSSSSFLSFDTFEDEGVSILPHSPPPFKVADSTTIADVFHETERDYIDVHPNDFILALSEEWFEFPSGIAGMVKAKSTMGRLGLQVSNGDACWFDPGFKGYAVLEIKNNGPMTYRLKSGMKIGQMIFMDVDGCRLENIYDGNYRNQRGFQFDKMHQSLQNIGRDAVKYAREKIGTKAAS